MAYVVQDGDLLTRVICDCGSGAFSFLQDGHGTCAAKCMACANETGGHRSPREAILAYGKRLGAKRTTTAKLVECDACNGEGEGSWLCGACNGSGEGYADGTRCSTCHGSGGGDGLCEKCEGTGKMESDEEEA